MLKRLPQFTRENYHDTGHKGARFVLFEGPNHEGYIRLSTKSTDYHTDIFERFMSEIQTTTNLPPERFHQKGGGYYFLTFDENNIPTGIKFWKDSTNYGRFDENLLIKTIKELGEEFSIPQWNIEE